MRVLGGVDERIDAATDEQEQCSIQLVAVAPDNHHDTERSEAHQKSQNDQEEVLGDYQLVVLRTGEPMTGLRCHGSEGSRWGTSAAYEGVISIQPGCG